MQKCKCSVGLRSKWLCCSDSIAHSPIPLHFNHFTHYIGLPCMFFGSSFFHWLSSILLSRSMTSTTEYKPTHYQAKTFNVRPYVINVTEHSLSLNQFIGLYVRGVICGSGGARGQLPPKQKNNMQCKTTHTCRHILARRLPCHCDLWYPNSLFALWCWNINANVQENH